LRAVEGIGAKLELVELKSGSRNRPCQDLAFLQGAKVTSSKEGAGARNEAVVSCILNQLAVDQDAQRPPGDSGRWALLFSSSKPARLTSIARSPNRGFG
jgi:hypothetical protein